MVHRFRRFQSPEVPEEFMKKYWFTDDELSRAFKFAEAVSEGSPDKPVMEQVVRAGEKLVGLLYRDTSDDPLKPFDSLKLPDSLESGIASGLFLAVYPRWKAEGKIAESAPVKGHRHMIVADKMHYTAGDVGGIYPIFEEEG